MVSNKMKHSYNNNNSNKKAGIYMATISLLLLVLTLKSVSCYIETEKVTYDGFTLFRTFPQREQHIDGLRALRGQECDGIEFWTEPVGLNRTVDVMVSPDKQDYFTEQIRHLRLPTKRMIYDVGEVIKKTNLPKSRFNRRRLLLLDNQNVSLKYQDSAESFYSQYQSYAAIEQRLQEFGKDSKVKLEVVGQSYEGRNLYLVKISSDPDAQKPVIFLDAGHHAREWISHSTLLYIMESLLNDQLPTIRRRQSPEQNLDNDVDSGNLYAMWDEGEVGAAREPLKSTPLRSSLKSLLDKYDFWFIPVVNPDGYVHTHNYDRLWRKTRSKNGWCAGVDPNRNYPFKWLGKGTSSSTCDEIYAGPKPLSEPETRLVAKVLKENSNIISMYISLHAYSQVILTPYGYDRVVSKDYDDQIRVAQAGINSIYSVRGTYYKAGGAAIVLYPAAGGSDDFAYESGIKYTFTMELPDRGNYGFLLPSKEIIPVGQETREGLVSMIEAM